MRILHVETGMNLYGGARQVEWLLRGLASEGVESLLVCPAGSAISAERFPPAVTVTAMPMAGDLDLRFPGRLAHAIRAWRPDLVHLHSRRGADVLGGIAGRRCGVPVVLSRRVSNPESRWLAPLKYRLYDRVITISEAVARALRAAGVDPARLRVVHSAVPPSGPVWPRARFLGKFGLPDTGPVVVMAAQFIPRKGHRVLLNALPAVREAHPDARFLLLGQGPLEDEIRRRVAAAGLDHYVVLGGFHGDLAAFLGAADLLVHPALDEGLGVVALEAAAAGLPVVAGRAGGLPEVVRDGENGLLVAPGDAGALAEALVRVLGDAALRKRLGAAGRALVAKEFSVPGMVRGNLGVYEELLA